MKLLKEQLQDVKNAMAPNNEQIEQKLQSGNNAKGKLKQ